MASNFSVAVFGNFVPAPYCAHLLGMLGATVTKVEPIGGDPLLESQPGLYRLLNKGFEVRRLDLRSSSDLGDAQDIAATHDVVIEAFRPGKLAKFGLDYGGVAQTNPTVVYCSMSGFGQHGPLRDKVGHDLTYLAWSGVLDLPSESTGGRHRPSVPIADAAASLFATISILASLLDRGKTGRGVHIDAPIVESALALAVLRTGWLGDPLDKRARSFPHIVASSDMFVLADRRAVAVSLHEDHFWDRFVSILSGRWPDLASDKYKTLAGRKRCSEELGSLLRRVFEEARVEDVERLIADPDLPIEVVQSVEDALSSSHGRARRLSDTANDLTHVGFPALFDGSRLFPAGVRSRGGPDA